MEKNGDREGGWKVEGGGERRMWESERRGGGEGGRRSGGGRRRWEKRGYTSYQTMHIYIQY